MNLAARDAPFLDSLRTLRCAAAVVVHGSALRAAKALHLSQPAVTRAIQKLEHVCGVALFERGGRGMAATVPGRLVSRRTQALLLLLEQGAKAAHALGARHHVALCSAQHFAARVTPSSLQALAAIALCGSEARAATHLQITPATVHRVLEQLQHLVGVHLFHRSTHGTRLTPAGDALLHRVQLAFAELRALHADLAPWRGEVRGELVIGALPLSVSLLLPTAVDAVFRAHPALKIRAVDGTYESLVQQLLRADIDLLLGALRFPPPDGIQQKVLMEDSLAVVAQAGHPVFALPKPGLADLLAHEWVLPLPHSPAESALHRAFAQAGLPPPTSRLYAGSPTLTRAVVLQTGRLALASLAEALGPEAAPLCIVPIPLPQTVRHIGMAWRSEGETAADLTSLLDVLQGTYAAAKPGPKKWLHRSAAITPISMSQSGAGQALSLAYTGAKP
ncbi:LysR family transcriptional regulator [Comamonas sp. GB3 AK4-5]|uniref:LysR family transcriptional regulator n=1 Tax=Comamonas sp. GB3 AK4-5 TaxID=3231487 RepID=UPI00351E45E0